jgi:membrane protein YdbS with pleckstrin-like domain
MADLRRRFFARGEKKALSNEAAGGRATTEGSMTPMAMTERNEAEAGEEARPGVPHAHPVRDVSGFEAGEGAPVFRPGMPIFAPTAVILLFYATAWVALGMVGKSDSGIARLSLLVVTIAVPLLALHAFLRLQTIRLQVAGDVVRYHPGWPKDASVVMPVALIERVAIRRGLAGRMLRAGTLSMQLTTGQRISVADLADPERAAEAIRDAMGPAA